MRSGDGVESFDALIVGAGFAGLYMLHRLNGLGLKVRVLEAGRGVGGTWYWNRYPGARCDIESTQYSYQFSPDLEQDWCWSERYATQPEILRYAEHVADRFDLKRHISFETRVKAARYDETSKSWTLETAAGARLSAPICIMATGCLSAPVRPRIDGADSFAGATYHTGEWPHTPVDFTGLRVAVIGTGSSAIQAVPLIARQARQLLVFQRTAAYSVPARNIQLSPAVLTGIKAIYRQLRSRARQMPMGVISEVGVDKAAQTPAEVRNREFERRWQRGGLTFLDAYCDLMTDPTANATAAEFVRAKIRSIVRDPQTARRLEPAGFIGGKRLCVDIGYYETFNRENVSLVDVSRDPIERITPTGVRQGGRDLDVDAIVYATGFDAMTGALERMDIRGRNSLALKDKWRHGPRTCLGLMMAGFPNLFTITGPGSPSVLTNLLPSIEQHVDWIADCIGHMRRQGVASIEPTVAVEDAWVAHNAETAAASLRVATDGWYVGANVPGKARVFLPYHGGFPAYVARCNEVAARGYDGFVLEKARQAVPAE